MEWGVMVLMLTGQKIAEDKKGPKGPFLCVHFSGKNGHELVNIFGKFI